MTPSTSKAAVLIVDDERDNREALVRVLRQHLECFVAGDAQEALRVFKANPHIQTVISDQRMPGLSGVELLAMIRDLDESVTRVLLTGYADIEAVVLAINQGQVWKYVSKPWEPEELLRVVLEASERCEMKRHLKETTLSLNRALAQLRAKDWARDRLLQILLHEFRTLPNLVQAVESVDALTPQQQRFAGLLHERLRVLLSDVESLVQEERAQQLEQNLVDLSVAEWARLTEASSLPKTPLSCSNEDLASWTLRLPLDSTQASLRYLLERLIEAQPQAQFSASVERHANKNAPWIFVFRASHANPIRPKSLERSALDGQDAWNALLEPFVGAEPFENHSRGLRLEVARHVRNLNAWLGRPEFQSVGDGRLVEFLLPLRCSSKN